jgi:hypothetical protein
MNNKAVFSDFPKKKAKITLQKTASATKTSVVSILIVFLFRDKECPHG